MVGSTAKSNTESAKERVRKHREAKPRPALVVQSDLSLVGLTVTYLPITGDLEHNPQLRVPVSPSSANGLRKASEIMVDRIQTCTLSRIGGIVGHIDGRTMKLVETALMVHLGLV